jgi:hypothetical protein
MADNKYEAALAARTQSLFREVNERVRAINDAFAGIVPLGDWACECAEPTCIDRITLTMDEYEVLRGDPTTFAVAPGQAHVWPEIEDVVVRKDRFWVVRKRGTAAELATKVDPRSNGRPPWKSRIPPS